MSCSLTTAGYEIFGAVPIVYDLSVRGRNSTITSHQGQDRLAKDKNTQMSAIVIVGDVFPVRSVQGWGCARTQPGLRLRHWLPRPSTEGRMNRSVI